MSPKVCTFEVLEMRYTAACAQRYSHYLNQSTHVVFKVRQYHAPHNIHSIQIEHAEGGRDKIKVDSLCCRPEQTVQLQKSTGLCSSC